MNRLERLEALAEKAKVQQPWRYRSDSGYLYESGQRTPILHLLLRRGPANRDAHGDYIVAAVNALPDLLVAVRAAKSLEVNYGRPRDSWSPKDLESVTKLRAALEPLYREEPADGR